MLAVVKMHHIKEQELLEVKETAWYRGTKNSITPGENLRMYRELHGYTQAALGTKLGNVPRQNVSNMEKDRRPISKETARKLAAIFEVSVEKFI